MSAAINTNSTRPITLAISAMGGQGGGVLANWVRDLAESNGYLAQSTSVPGVAQRTGATIYYLELFPHSEVAEQPPVLGMNPVPGEVDIVIAAELVEAGRAIQRGFVTPANTVLISTTHRSYTVDERQQKGNGLVDGDKIIALAEQEAKQLVAFDMQEVARQAGSVISSALFGALAGAEVLPFAREQFEQAIAAGGVGVEASLAAFAKAYELAKGEPQAEPQPQTEAEPPQLPETAASPSAQKLLARIKAEVPEPCQWLAFNGVKQLVDYQDPDYAHQYLDRLAPYFEKDSAENHYRLATALIKQLALWMAFQDTIRVAEQKIQAPRMATIRREVKASDDQLVYPVEYLHPRPEEVCDSLPKAIGEWALNNRFARRFIDGLFGHGRKLQTGRLSGFIPLYTLAKLKPWRRKTLRYAKEDTEIQSWLKRTEQALAKDYDSACEIIECQALIKGYSDTHANGYKNYQAIMAVVDIWLEETDANPIAERLRSLQRAALSGEDDSALQAALIQF